MFARYSSRIRARNGVLAFCVSLWAIVMDGMLLKRSPGLTSSELPWSLRITRMVRLRGIYPAKLLFLLVDTTPMK